MAATYTVWVTDPYGNRLALLSDPLSIDINRSVNNVGALSLVLRGDYPEIYLAEDNRIEVWRSLDGRPPSLVTNTSWFLRRFEKRTAKGQRTYTIGAVSALELTKRRIVAYNTDDAQSNKDGPADDVLKSIMRENLGALATDTSRSWNGLLSIAGDLSQGPNTVQSISRKEVFGVLQDIAQAAAAAGTPVFFDITGYGSNLVFQTWVGIRGIDHTFPYSQAPVVLSPQMGNLDDCSLVHDYTDEITAVYSAGSGTTGSRHVIGLTDPERYSMSPFNRREQFITNSQATSDDELTVDAYTALRQGRPKTIFTGTIVQKAQTLYGLNWEFGDLLTAVYEGETFNCRVDSISINVQDGKETIKASLRSE